MADYRLPEGDCFEEQPWLELIWAANEIDPTMFMAPIIEEWWAGGTVEEYPDARVIFTGDDTVRIVSKTDKGHDILTAAAGKLGV